MKRPLAYLTAAWSGQPEIDMELAAGYCRLAYKAGFSPICPLIYLPLFLDDVFGNYDDERLAQTMQYLSHHTDRQIFLFTGRKEILRLLDEKEILYHLISL